MGSAGVPLIVAGHEHRACRFAKVGTGSRGVVSAPDEAVSSGSGGTSMSTAALPSRRLPATEAGSDSSTPELVLGVSGIRALAGRVAARIHGHGGAEYGDDDHREYDPVGPVRRHLEDELDARRADHGDDNHKNWITANDLRRLDDHDGAVRLVRDAVGHASEDVPVHPLIADHHDVGTVLLGEVYEYVSWIPFAPRSSTSARARRLALPPLGAPPRRPRRG
jgi:hypothetical protein